MNFLLRKSDTMDIPKFKYRIADENDYICSTVSNIDAVAAVLHTDLEKLNRGETANCTTVFRLFEDYNLDEECKELLYKPEYDIAILQQSHSRSSLKYIKELPALSEGEHGVVKKRTDDIIVRLYNDTVEDGAPYPNMVKVFHKLTVGGKTDWYLVDVYQAKDDKHFIH